MVSVAWTFNSSILTFSFFQVFRTIFRFHELKVSSFCRHKKRLGSTTSHEHRRRKDWMDDFALSVNEASSSAIGYLLFTLWILGIIIMIILAIRSALFLHSLKNLHHLLKIRMFKNYIDAA